MKNLESGRSMIEMLGVLAIIGVLSIGGLAGYTMAMNRHKANNIIDYAAKCAVIVQTKGDGSKAVASTACSADDVVGTSTPSAPELTSISAERAENGNTTVTIAFSKKNKVTAAIASRLDKDDGKTFTYVPDTDTWSSAS